MHTIFLRDKTVMCSVYKNDFRRFSLDRGPPRDFTVNFHSPNLLCYRLMMCCMPREMVRDICAGKRVELSDEEVDQSAQDNWK